MRFMCLDRLCNGQLIRKTLKMNTTKMAGTQAVVESLVKEQVDTIFRYPGEAIMPIYDALYVYEETINHILVRHEQEAITAAQGDARTSGTTRGALGTEEPGAT